MTESRGLRNRRSEVRLLKRLTASGEPVEELASVEHLEVAEVGLEHVAVAGDQHRSGGLREGDEVVVVRVAGRAR
jgi:hypothetical protein